MSELEKEKPLWILLIRSAMNELPDFILGFVRLVVLFFIIGTTLIETGFQVKIPSGSDPVTFFLLLFVGYLLLTVIDKARRLTRNRVLERKHE